MLAVKDMTDTWRFKLPCMKTGSSDAVVITQILVVESGL